MDQTPLPLDPLADLVALRNAAEFAATIADTIENAARRVMETRRVLQDAEQLLRDRQEAAQPWRRIDRQSARAGSAAQMWRDAHESRMAWWAASRRHWRLIKAEGSWDETAGLLRRIARVGGAVARLHCAVVLHVAYGFVVGVLRVQAGAEAISGFVD